MLECGHYLRQSKWWQCRKEAIDMLNRLTLEQSRNGMKNMLFCGLIALATWLVIGIVVSVGFGQPLRASLGTSHYVLLGLLFSVAMIHWFCNKLGAGSLIADCGTIDRKACLFLPVYALYLVAEIFDGNAVKPRDGLLAAAFFAWWLLLLFERIQIRENGIRCGSGFFRWSRLTSYYWDPEEKSTLIVKPASRWWFSHGECKLAVPTGEVKAVDDLLGICCPEARQATPSSQSLAPKETDEVRQRDREGETEPVEINATDISWLHIAILVFYAMGGGVFFWLATGAGFGLSLLVGGPPAVAGGAIVCIIFRYQLAEMVRPLPGEIQGNYYRINLAARVREHYPTVVFVLSGPIAMVAIALSNS